MNGIACASCRRVVLLRLEGRHIQPDDVEPLVGEQCPACGSTRYVLLRSLGVDELCLSSAVELLGDGRIVRKEDV